MKNEWTFSCLSLFRSGGAEDVHVVVCYKQISMKLNLVDIKIKANKKLGEHEW